VLVLVLAGLTNLMRSKTGRAFMGVRDSEAAAYSLGIWVAGYKVLAFVISAMVTGLAGALLAHHVRFLTPEGFGLILSLELVLMVTIGGLGSLRGAILGAVLISMLPTFISRIKPMLPDQIAKQFGLETFVFGLVLALFVLVRAQGPERALDQVQDLPGDLPAVPQGHVQARQELHEVGALQMSVFEVKDVSLRFGGVQAIGNVSFNVEQGEVFAIIGPNGAGKTSMLNVITRVFDPTSGSVRVRGAGHHARCRATRWCTAASRAPSRTSSCSKAAPCSTTCCWAAPLRPRQLLRPVALDTGRAPAEATSRAHVEDVIELLDLMPYRQQPGGRPALWRAQGGRAGPRAVHAAAPAAARRAGLRPEPGGNPRARVLDRRHPEGPRHHRDHGRARHVAGVGGRRPRAVHEHGPGAGAGHAARRCRATRP
jgi:energy-coupling factor transporter ATP-binding protein EcfA2